LIQNRTLHRQIAQWNNARAKNNSVGQKKDPRRFPKKKGNGKLPQPLLWLVFSTNFVLKNVFYSLSIAQKCLRSYFFTIPTLFVFVKCVLSPFHRSEVSQKLLLCDPDPFCFCKMRTIAFLSSGSDLEVTSKRYMFCFFKMCSIVFLSRRSY